MKPAIVVAGILAGAVPALSALVPSAHAADRTAGKDTSTIEYIAMSDGVKIAVAVHLPARSGHFPTLFGASPYRFDNDATPKTDMFLWRETGPIDWYLDHGYAFVHMDVRGTGRSAGDFGLSDRRERRDLYEVIEWIARQSWSDGKVGGIGESYYGHSQYAAAVERPPHLACIAPYDGGDDTYGGEFYNGGVPGDFPSVWYNANVRPINRHPANNAPSRDLPIDIPYQISQHPVRDEYWRERDLLSALPQVTIPVYSIGVWAKLDSHLSGDIDGYLRVSGPKKLLVTGPASIPAARAQFEDLEFHEKVLLPFYDWCLKGQRTDYVDRPNVSYVLRGDGRTVSATQWPPAGLKYQSFYLSSNRSGAVESLNDGSLQPKPASAPDGPTVFSYPDPNWTLGVVQIGPHGPEPVRRVLTFTSPPLEQDLTITGPSELFLYAASSREDTDFLVRVADQSPRPEAAGPGGQAPSVLVTKGWLRASLRATDPAKSVPGAPALTLDHKSALVPGQVYPFEIPLVPMAYKFKKGNRIRVEIANGDSPITDPIFSHSYTPDKVGTDTFYSDPSHPSRLELPVLAQ